MAKDPISDEDKALFRSQMRTVKPLQEKTKKVSRPKSLPIPTPPKHKIKEPPAIQERYLSDYISNTVLSETTLSYSQPGLPTLRFRELKKGQIPWEARLDLHGLNTEAARTALCRFIEEQAQNNKRCLLIIHGKGSHNGEPPVIKNLVYRWLPQLEEVLAFHSALPKDGGYGAVYVLLKKNKQR